MLGYDPIADVRSCGDVVTMKRLGAMAYWAVIGCIVLLTAREVVEPSLYLYERHTSGMVTLGVIGWFVATLGPLVLSVWVWRAARRVKQKWLWHLLFIPCSIAIYRLGASTLFYAAGVPDGDSVEGYTLLAGNGFLLFTLFVHTAALVAQAAAMVRSNVR